MKAQIEMLLDGVVWVENKNPPTGDGSLPYATHEGVFDLMGHKMRCYRLSNGKSVFNADDVQAWFDTVPDAAEEVSPTKEMP